MFATTRQKIRVVLAATLLALTTAGFGASPAAAEGFNSEPKFTIAPGLGKFEKNLEELAATNAEAAVNLEKFRTLSLDQKKQIEQAILDGTAAKELEEFLTASNSEKSGNISKVTVEKNRVAIKENIEKSSAIPTFASYEARTFFSVSQKIFGITITKLGQNFIYQVQGNSVISTKACTTYATNYNFVVSLTEDTSHWLWGSRGVCETTWHGHIIVKRFGIRIDKIQHLEVNSQGFYDGWLVNA